ncbi:MAG TPA: ABC transporter permease [Gammaproteobacteria bacterium]|nr:ABC transporter permease [Gammaproteobacteria bacterium]
MRGLFAVIILDMKRLWGDRIRLVSSLIQPLLYLFMLGSGLGASSTLGSNHYLPYIFPGVVALSLLFTSVFAAILIVFDRQMGFLKAVLVAPVPRPAIAIGKVISGAIQALVPGTLMMVFMPLIGLRPSLPEFLCFLGAAGLAAIAFSALGVAVAARFKSMTVFPIISNAMLLPMFFLSGALYPLDVAPRWLQLLAHADPVAYAVDLMRGSLFGKTFFPVWLSFVVLAGFITLTTWLATRIFTTGEDA